MSDKHTPTPWKFERQGIYIENARLTGKTLAEHEGYFRDNDGGWAIGFDSSDGGGRIASVTFKGKAKRGQAWNAPDPEGQANAELIVRAVNAFEPMVEALRELAERFEISSHSQDQEGDISALAKAKAALKLAEEGKP